MSFVDMFLTAYPNITLEEFNNRECDTWCATAAVYIKQEMCRICKLGGGRGYKNHLEMTIYIGSSAAWSRTDDGIRRATKNLCKELVIFDDMPIDIKLSPVSQETQLGGFLNVMRVVITRVVKPSASV